MNVFVTGASGFVGTALCQKMQAWGDQIVAPSSKNCDLTKAESLLRFSDRKYDRIYHLAAWTQAGDFCLHHPGEQWVINQQINTNLLTWWQQYQPQAKLISIGTSCSYDPQLPLVEENYLVGTPIESLFTYAQTKRMLYVGQLALARQFGLNYLTVIPSTLYGPGYHTDDRQLHFIFDLIRKILRAKLYGEIVTLWGDGHQKRELVYIDDFIDALLCLGNTAENDLINIGAGEEFSIRDFAGMICKIVGYDSNLIQYDVAKYIGAKSKCLDTAKLKKLLPDLRLTLLESGLARTIAWFEQHPTIVAPIAKRNVT